MNITLDSLLKAVRDLLNEPADKVEEAGRFYSTSEITEWINDAIVELCEETAISYEAFEYELTHDTYDYNLDLFNESLEVLYLNELNYKDISGANGITEFIELPKTTRRELSIIKTGTTEKIACSLFSNIIHLSKNPTTGDIIEVVGRWEKDYITGYKITGITINSGGSGYQDAEAVTITSPNSTKSATGTITVVAGAITAISIDTEGIGFEESGDTLTITGDTSGANDATVTSYTSSSVDFPLGISAKNAVKKYAVALGFLKKNKEIADYWMKLYMADKEKIKIYQEKLLGDTLIKGLTVNKRKDHNNTYNWTANA